MQGDDFVGPGTQLLRVPAHFNHWIIFTFRTLAIPGYEKSVNRIRTQLGAGRTYMFTQITSRDARIGEHSKGEVNWPGAPLYGRRRGLLRTPWSSRPDDPIPNRRTAYTLRPAFTTLNVTDTAVTAVVELFPGLGTAPRGSNCPEKIGRRWNCGLRSLYD